MEAFSDGVFAIIITIMVLEMKVPHGVTWAALLPLWPVFLSYILSFITLGIFWNNHHHLTQATQQVSGGTLWANLNLLFWLSLMPFVTGWMGHNHFASLPVALYGVVLFQAGIAYYILAHNLISKHGRDSTLARAIGGDFKGIISVVMYAVAIPLAFWKSALSCTLYAMVILIWFIPDRRIEKLLSEK
jgi:uncharacterized membrane protein